MSRFIFGTVLANVARVNFAEDTGGNATGGTTTAAPAQSGKKQKKARVIKKGSADEKLIKLLKRHAGEKSIDELAPMVETRSGDPIKPESLESQVSKVLNTLKKMGLPDDKIAALKPKGYNQGRQGRGAMESFSPDELTALLDSEDDEAGE